MLGRMMIHGLVAVILIGGAAAVYAQASDNGTPAQVGNGYLQPATDGLRNDKDGRKHAAKSERRAEGRRAEGQKGHDRPHGNGHDNDD